MKRLYRDSQCLNSFSGSTDPNVYFRSSETGFSHSFLGQAPRRLLMRVGVKKRFGTSLTGLMLVFEPVFSLCPPVVLFCVWLGTYF